MSDIYELNQGLPEYRNAAEYDEENSWGADDDFYLQLAQEIGGPVLDVGCGTGRLTRAIAQAGLDATGLDVTAEMLQRAALLSDGLDVEWVVGDARALHLGRRFRLILMTGHAFQHLLTNQDISAFLQGAREHLLDDGYLAFETRNFAAKSFGGSEEPTLWKSVQDDSGRWIDLLIGSRYDPDSGVELLIGERLIRETGQRERSTSSLRYLALDKLNAMLQQHEFLVEQQYGFWDKQPPRADLPEYISICRPTG